MYVVFKAQEWPNTGKTVPAGNRKFASYEAARQWVRKRLRKTVAMRNFFWTTNPQIGDYGYSIKKVS